VKSYLRGGRGPDLEENGGRSMAGGGGEGGGSGDYSRERERELREKRERAEIERDEEEEEACTGSSSHQLCQPVWRD
jgi:hypothetical protein